MTSPLKNQIRQASRKSDLASWLAKNHVWFAKELKEAEIPNWDVITELLNKEGLTDKYGHPYNKVAVRMAVRRFLRSLPQPAITPPIAQPAQSLAIATPIVTQPAETDDAKLDFIAISRAVKKKRSIK